MKFRLQASLLLTFLAGSAFSQIGGNSVYEFLTLPASPKVTALGGSLVPVHDKDFNLVLNNPSLLDPSFDGQIGFGFMNYFANVQVGNVVLAKDCGKAGTLSGAMQFIRYGDFTEADASGNVTGSFSSGEYALNAGWGRKVDSVLSVGVNAKLIASYFQQYSSYGAAVDLVANYYYPRYDFSFVAAIRNLGVEFKPYTPGNREPLPLDVQVGFAKKLSKAPLRLSLIGHHLQKPDLTYANPVNPLAGNNYFSLGTDNTSSSQGSGGTLDKVMRHVIVGAEVLLSKNFNVQLSYNYERRKELAIQDRTSLVGFGWGFGFKISRFQVSFGHGTYHLAGGSNHFSIVTNLSEFKSRKAKS